MLCLKSVHGVIKVVTFMYFLNGTFKIFLAYVQYECINKLIHVYSAILNLSKLITLIHTAK